MWIRMQSAGPIKATLLIGVQNRSINEEDIEKHFKDAETALDILKQACGDIYQRKRKQLGLLGESRFSPHRTAYKMAAANFIPLVNAHGKNLHDLSIQLALSKQASASKEKQYGAVQLITNSCRRC